MVTKSCLQIYVISFLNFHVFLCPCRLAYVWAHLSSRPAQRPKVEIRNYPDGSSIILNESGSCYQTQSSQTRLTLLGSLLRDPSLPLKVIEEMDHTPSGIHMSSRDANSSSLPHWKSFNHWAIIPVTIIICHLSIGCKQFEKHFRLYFSLFI